MADAAGVIVCVCRAIAFAVLSSAGLIGLVLCLMVWKQVRRRLVVRKVQRDG